MSHSEPAQIDADTDTLTPVRTARPVVVAAPDRGDDRWALLRAGVRENSEPLGGVGPK
jgi:hypothetical protein